MGVVKPSIPTDFQSIRNQRILVDGYSLFTKIDPPYTLEAYLKMMEAEGFDTFVVLYESLMDKPPSPTSLKRKYDSAQKKKKTPSKKL